MNKFLLFFSMVFLFSSTAFAYDHLFTNDMAVIGDTHSIKTELAFLYTTASKGYDSESESYDLEKDSTRDYGTLKFRFTVIDDLEAFGVLPFEKWDSGGNGETGVGDIWLGLKLGLLPEGSITLRGALDIPVGDDKKGIGEPGGFGLDGGIMSQILLGEINLNGQVGIRYNVEDSDTKWKPGIGIYLDGEGAFELSEAVDIQAGLEIMFIGDGKLDGNDAHKTDVNWIELNAGANYMFTEYIGVKGDILYNISGKNTDQYIGLLFRLCYGY
jgi:hypothetical protein